MSMIDFGDSALTGPEFHTPTIKGSINALGLRNGRIVWLGREDELPSGLPRQRLAADRAQPGWIDCHLHLVWYGTQRLRQVDLTGSTTLGETLDRIRSALDRPAPPASPLIAYGLSDELLVERRLPLRAELDILSASRPILVQRICGHIAVANTPAIACLGPDFHGSPGANLDTGRFEESAAMTLLTAVGGHGPGAAAKFDIDFAEQAILEGCRALLAEGITTVATMLDTLEEYQAYQRLHARGLLPVRVSMMPPMRNLEDVARMGIRQGDGDDRLRWGPMKMFADGTLGARTALLSFDYADAPGQRGTAVMPREAMVARARAAAGVGFGVVIHTIGDLALDHAMDAVEAARDAGQARGHRIEHLAVVRDDQVRRLALLKVGVAVQPQFVTSDPWTPDRLGGRTAWAYRFADLAAAGIPMGLSSDAPIERIDSGACLGAAVGGHPWRPVSQNLSEEVATRAYTEGSALLSGFADVTGRLSAGLAADLTFTKEGGGGKHVAFVDGQRV
jgi:predicted amidohydrolase YtcJ